MHTLLPPKWPLSSRLLPFPAAILDKLNLNAVFRTGTIFRKSRKNTNTPLHLSRFQRYAEESDLGLNLPTPWTSED